MSGDTVLTIVVPFRGAERLGTAWAHEEDRIDFAHDPRRALRCTTAFAALELKRYLSRTLRNTAIVLSGRRPRHGAFIELSSREETRDGSAFAIVPAAPGVRIVAKGRPGVLTGAYELLRLQGWRWYAPGDAGEVGPSPAETLAVPVDTVECSPAMELCRGLDFEYASMDCVDLFLWMARNRMNMAGCFAATSAICHKLGMSLKAGGHVFERILGPDRVMPSGRTLWDEHPEWFGLPETGKRVKEKAQATQFCVSQGGLIEFLGGELIENLRGPWRSADRIALWGFDTWGSVCCCESCGKLGNASDQALFFLSKMRTAVNGALRRGRISHDVRLAACAYEGTATIRAPARPVPRNLIGSGDYIVFYPINRCYAHDLADDACRHNAAYQDALKEWCTRDPRLPLVVGEYYNVSKFEDLPLLFTRRIAGDLPAYRSAGVRGMTYMHVPVVNWAVRTLTQALYAQLAWDAETDVPAFIDEYFRDWYGPHALPMRTVYGLIEEAWQQVAGWRAWAQRSVLSQLLAWDGKKPGRPLAVDGHLGSVEATIASGRRSEDLLRRALGLIDEARGEEAVRYEERLGEDRRLLLYGIDTMRIMTELAAYHDALCRDAEAEAAAVWQSVEETAERLDSRYLPIGYTHPGPGLVSLDALTRTQLRPLLRRCREHRRHPGTW